MIEYIADIFIIIIIFNIIYFYLKEIEKHVLGFMRHTYMDMKNSTASFSNIVILDYGR